MQCFLKNIFFNMSVTDVTIYTETLMFNPNLKLSIKINKALYLNNSVIW